MNDDNPYRAPAPVAPEERRKRRPLGPIMTGLVAIVLATVVMKISGLFISVFVVSSWWVYKFWPRSPAAEVPEARAYLQRLEDAPLGAAPSAEPDSPTSNDPENNFLGDLRL